MARFASAHAAGEHAEQVVERCLAGLAGHCDGHDLGFLYVTDPLAAELPRMVEALRAGSGIQHWSAAVGIGVCASGLEYWTQPAASVLSGAFGAESFRVFGSEAPMLAGISGVLDGWRDQARPMFAVVHADPRAKALLETITALSAWMPDGYLAGGLASARGDTGPLLAPVARGGVGGVMFAGSVGIATRHTQGCSPIGPRHRITAADGNLLVTLDGRPALEVFREDIGEVLARDLRRVGGYIFAGLPVTGTDTGDYLVRNLLGIDPEQGLIAIAERVEPGEEVLFCRRDADSARVDLRRMLAEIRTCVGDRRPAGGLYVSCLARGPALFGAPSAEMGIIAEELGDFPLAGFFANGEISSDRVYAYTGVLSLFL